MLERAWQSGITARSSSPKPGDSPKVARGGSATLMEESLAAVEIAGIELHGVCLFPAVDMPSWQPASGYRWASAT
jgi:hypothetical protein